MEPVGKAALVRQYELLLVHRHRFQMADTIASVHAVVATLQRAEALLGTVSQRREASSYDARAAASHARHHQQRKATYHDVMDSIATRLTLLVGQIPFFLGDTDLHVFVRSLREFVRHDDLELFWDLNMDDEENQMAEELTGSVARELEAELKVLEEALGRDLPTAVALREKREHLVQLVDESLLVLSKSSSSRTSQYEADKKQLMNEFHRVLRDPALQRVKQLDVEIEAFEVTMVMMLEPHFEICRPIAAANAEVVRGAAFTDRQCGEIGEFVRFALSIKDSAVAFRSALQDAARFVRQLKLFEKAASLDSFVVFSSALKLNFAASVDDELFMAYAGDWTDKQLQRTELIASREFAEASQRVAELKDEVMAAHLRVLNSRQNVALNDPTKAKLSAQIAETFEEAGGDATQIVQMIE